jgi:Rrf2 family transcriptional regulator, cysteine metabolism repressor
VLTPTVFYETPAMHISQKCQYTLRALYELAKHYSAAPINAAEIAEAQAIPPRFLELILQGLKDSWQVESRRGNNGGYVLAVSPESITVGDVIRMVDGSLAPVQCMLGREQKHCRLKGQCTFMEVWQKAQAALEEVYDSTTLQDLINNEPTIPARMEQTEPLEYIV